MSTAASIYCLDANVLIQAWQKYYSPKFCPDYWNVLNELGIQRRIFISEMVYEEITRTDDDLADWLKNSKIPVRPIDESVATCLKAIYAHNVLHKNLVGEAKGRSLADPWIIAHAINEKATVVTKEEKIIAINSDRIKIPNVCDNMGVRWINDFQLVTELDIMFKCNLK